jgi:hypothetical protein
VVLIHELSVDSYLLRCVARCVLAIQRWHISLATPPCLRTYGNAGLRKTGGKLYPRDFVGGVQAVGSMVRSVLWATLSGLILIKEAVICNIDCRIFLVISILPDILWEEAVWNRRTGTVQVCVKWLRKLQDPIPFTIRLKIVYIDISIVREHCEDTL